jgi:hypothetical protein
MPAQRHHSEVLPSVLVSYPQEFLHQKDAHDNTLSPSRGIDMSNTRKLSNDTQNIPNPMIRKVRTHE